MKTRAFLTLLWFFSFGPGSFLRAATENIGSRGEELLTLDNGAVRIGIDRKKGAAITWLSWDAYPKNIVNSADPGRLIQQSYYAGLLLDRRADRRPPLAALAAQRGPPLRAHRCERAFTFPFAPAPVSSNPG